MTTLYGNLLAGPGAGKSTTASKVFSMLKDRGVKVELVTEFAKDLTYSNPGALGYQPYVWGTQVYRNDRLDGLVDVVITDCPPLLCSAYTEEEELNVAIRSHFARKADRNVNFFLNRTKPYASYGRNQTENEARDLDIKIRGLLDDFDFLDTTGDTAGAEFITAILMNRLTQSSLQSS